MLLAICYLLSDTSYLKLATSYKNLIPFAPVVRLALVFSHVIVIAAKCEFVTLLA